MPMTRSNGEPIKSELPGTIQRSPKKAQETFAKAHDSAAEEYGDGERAPHDFGLRAPSGSRPTEVGVGGGPSRVCRRPD